MSGHSFHGQLRLVLDDPGQGRTGGPRFENDELVGESLDAIERQLSLVVEPINCPTVGRNIDETGVNLVDPGGVAAIVLHGHAQLCAFDTQRRIFGHEDRCFGLSEVEAGGENAMVRRLRVEHGRELLRDDPVQLDSEGAPSWKGYWVSEPAISRRPEILEKSYR